MAFGNSMNKRQTTNEDGTIEKYQNVFIDLHSGVRLVRFLPKIENGVLTNETEDEVQFMAVWQDVMIEGTKQPRRLILDYNSPQFKATEKGSEERKKFKRLFAVNVLDKTPILRDEDGNPVYADEKGAYNIMHNGKIGKVHTGTPEPHNAIRIFSASTGQPGGKHMLQQVVDLVDSGIVDNDGNALQLHEYDVRIRTTGTGIDTKRALREVLAGKTIAKEFLYAPRYDLVTWAKPWQQDALQAIFDGEDFNEVVTEYNLLLFPKLIEPEEKPAKKSTKKAANTFEDESPDDDLPF